MFKKILIANRGEIAVRIMRTARAMGIGTVAVYSDADRNAFHVREADEAIRLGPPAAAESYLLGDKVIEAALATGAEAIHPGYGFLSENAEFAEAIVKAGLVFIGPPASAIRAMGLKDAAKKLMEEANVPVVPGYHGANQDEAFLKQQAEVIGYPVLIKAVAGGGGKGMRRVEKKEDFDKALEGAKREGANAFGDDNVLIEKYVLSPRHIEVQVFADSHGNAVHLYERDCSIQRRHQKVVEEAPGPMVDQAMRDALGAAAVKAAKAIGYQGAGTIEFISPSAGEDAGAFYFMEMNTRLQVEHPVTEAITGQDLVDWQLRVAAGEALPLAQDEIPLNGHALEVRLYAENPKKRFLPATGQLRRFDLHAQGEGHRVDSGVEQGDEITPHYDPMIAKLIAWGPSRAEAINRMNALLHASDVAGCVTNLDFLRNVIDNDTFISGSYDTGFIEDQGKALIPSDEKSSLAFAIAALWLATPSDNNNPAGDIHSPWGSCGDTVGWRLWSGGAQVVALDDDGERLEVVVTMHKSGSRTIAVGEETFDVAAFSRDGSRATIDLGTRILHARVERDGDVLSLFLDGKWHHVSLLVGFGEDADAGDGGSSISAPLPGKITVINTKNGASVRRGDALIVLEAMKMEHTLEAPRDGVVTDLTIGVGDQVEEGATLLSLVQSEK